MLIRITLRFVILQIFLLSIRATHDEFESPVILKRMRRVVGGYETNIEEVPYLVNIRKNGKFHCGGSLLTPKCVLTAAHCVRNHSNKDFIVRGGVTFLTDFRYKTTVERIIMHPDFDKRNLNRDLAILKLDTGLSGPHIDTIQLSPVEVIAMQNLTVSGWGLTKEGNKTPSNHLRSVKLSILEQAECQELYADFRQLTEFMFCTSSQANRDACVADSGGPAVNEQGELVGVVSWGRKRQCARAKSPGVYVYVRALLPWIQQTLEQEHCFDT